MLIKTKTVTFRVDDIQTAYNDAVLSDRMLLAREIERLWLGALTDQSQKDREEVRPATEIGVRTESADLFHRHAPL
jgi:hypothetical protein